MPDALPFLSAHEAGALFRSGQLSPVELLEANLVQIEERDPELHAFVTVGAERARDEARRLTEELRLGRPRSALHGVTLAVKDVLDAAGYVTSNGVSLEGPPVSTSCAAVECLERAGVIVIGKTNTPAYAAYSDTSSTVGGTTRNAWNPDLSSGGSSGGSAVAVASGMCTLALGTDLGGSVRGPAAWSGIFGIRPSSGRISRQPHGWVDDTIEVVGAMSRDIRDLSVWFALARSVRDVGVASQRRGTLRIACSEDLDGRIAVADDVRSVFQQCVRGLTDAGHAVSWRSPRVDAAIEAIRPLRALRALATYGKDDLPIIERHNRRLFEFVRWAQTLSGEYLGYGARMRTLAWQENRDFFEESDVFIMPTAQISGIAMGQLQPASIAGRKVDDPLEVWLSTYVVSILGWPSVNIPCGWTVDGRPIGIQVIAPTGSDANLLSICERLCAQMGWKFDPRAGRRGGAAKDNDGDSR
ncbi:MAG: amidase [Burkholderiales bacterium]|nr:amidase [Burkholderiales bacterium]